MQKVEEPMTNSCASNKYMRSLVHVQTLYRTVLFENVCARLHVHACLYVYLFVNILSLLLL